MPDRPPLPEAAAPVSLGEHPRILVVKLATLGDLLLATPALRALRLRYPDAHIDVLTTYQAAPLLGHSPLVNRVFAVDKYAFDAPRQFVRRPRRVLGLIQLLTSLRRRRYDALLLLHHLTLGFGRLKYRALLRTLGARCTFGLDNGFGRFLDVRVPDSGFGARHEAEYALDVVAAAGARSVSGARGLHLADLGWEISVPGSEDQSGPPRIAMHPGSGNYSVARRWPHERFAELAVALHDEFGAAIDLVGASNEHALCDAVRAHAGDPAWMRNLAGDADPRELATLLGRCALFVGNDSFPMHVAALVGIPVVAIFGPSNARAWGPYAPDEPGRAAVIRRADLPCSPCFYRGHELGTPQGCPPRSCLTELGTQPALLAARRLLRDRLPDAAPAG
jgi:heptosyltransferase-2